MKFEVLGFLLMFISTSNAGISVHNEFYCYSRDTIRPQNEMHATLTSYETVRRSVEFPVGSKTVTDKITSHK